MTERERQHIIDMLDDDIMAVTEGRIKVEDRERSLFYLMKAREVAEKINPNEWDEEEQE